MGAKEAFKQKVEAEVELAHAKLAELKAQAKSSAADARVKYAVHIEELEQKVAATKARLKELGEASEDSLDRVKDGVENAWKALSLSVRDAAAKFKH
jgi:hypothetical protein